MLTFIHKGFDPFPFSPHGTCMHLNSIMETCLYVDNLASAEAFYRQVLGLSCQQRDPDRHVFFQCGDQMLLLFVPAASSSGKSDVPPHGSHGPGHVAFRVESNEFPTWQTHLAKHGVPIEQTVQWPHGGTSIYFRDPAGNSLELVSDEVWKLDADTDNR